MIKKNIIIILVIQLMITASSCADQKTALDRLCDQLKFENPKHGFVSSKPASIWEESLKSGSKSNLLFNGKSRTVNLQKGESIELGFQD